MVHEIEGFLCTESDGLRGAVRGFNSASAKDDGTEMVAFGEIPDPVRQWLTRPKDAMFYNIPPNVREAIDRWVAKGERAGDFVMSVLVNDLNGAVSRADPHSFRCLRDIIWYLNNECPSPCWGSQAAVDAWALRWDLST